MTWLQTNVVRPSPLLLELLACAAILVAALWVGIPRHLDGIDLADEGFVAYGAMRVLAGELPQRDFVSVQPPLSFYSIAALFALCGPSLVALRQLGLATHVAIA